MLFEFFYIFFAAIQTVYGIESRKQWRLAAEE